MPPNNSKKTDPWVTQAGLVLHELSRLDECWKELSGHCSKTCGNTREDISLMNHQITQSTDVLERMRKILEGNGETGLRTLSELMNNDIQVLKQIFGTLGEQKERTGRVENGLTKFTEKLNINNDALTNLIETESNKIKKHLEQHENAEKEKKMQIWDIVKIILTHYISPFICGGLGWLIMNAIH